MKFDQLFKSKKEDFVQGRKNPFQKDETFDPELELKRLKALPRNEKRGALVSFKEKLSFQMLGWAQFQDRFFSHLQRHPDVPFDFFVQKLKLYQERYAFSDADCKAALRMFRAYQERRAVIHKTLETYPHNKELFKALFGCYPKGTIERVDGPLTIYLRAHNAEDYAWIRSRTWKKEQEDTPSYSKKKRFGIGGHLKSTLVQELVDAVCVENADGAPFKGERVLIFQHEQQHAFYQFLLQYLERTTSEKTVQHLKKRMALWKTENAEGQRHVDSDALQLATFREFRLFRQIFEERLKNELLAYFIGKQPWRVIVEKLMRTEQEGGLYDYSSEFRGHVIQVSSISPKRTKNILEIVFKKEYRAVLLGGIHVLKSLETGGLPRQQIASLFTNVPLRRWPHILERVKRRK